MRVDLDELEAKARAVLDGGATFEDNARRSHELEVAAPAEVVVALVARIRELESALRSAVSLAEVHDPTGWHPDWLALLEKGVVLP